MILFSSRKDLRVGDEVRISGSGANRKFEIGEMKEKEPGILLLPKVGRVLSFIGVSFTTGGRTVKIGGGLTSAVPRLPPDDCTDGAVACAALSAAARAAACASATGSLEPVFPSGS